MRDRTELIRQDFPILQRTVNGGMPLVYLDNAATSQKPVAVLQAMDDYYRRFNANVHRGVHTLSEEATAAYEAARAKVAAFIHAPHTRQVIFTSGTTASINLVAIVLLSGLVVKLLRQYLTQQREGKRPHFHAADLPEVTGQLDPGMWQTPRRG